jgi:hypothetical protein
LSEFRKAAELANWVKELIQLVEGDEYCDYRRNIEQSLPALLK